MAVIEQRRKATIPSNRVRGEIVDALSGRPLAGRLYIRDTQGAWYFPDSAATNGTALPYQVRNGINTNAVEMHTTLSAHPFEVDLPPGHYTVTAERGPEYFSEKADLHVGEQPVELKSSLRRWTRYADVPPAASRRNVKGGLPAPPVTVDAAPVYYPRNTEYEIFTTAQRS